MGTSTTTADTRPGLERDNYLNHTKGLLSWILTLDHKRIGLLYLISILSAFFLAGMMAMPPDVPAEEPGTWDQVVDLYEQAKEAGETTSKDAYEWVREDFHSIGDWQYRVVELPFGSAETLEQELNDLGADRWECVWIEPRDNKMLGIFKRRTRTYLNRVPMGDLLKLVPKSEDDAGTE